MSFHQVPGNGVAVGAYHPRYFEGSEYPVGAVTRERRLERRIDQATKKAGEIAQSNSEREIIKARLAVTDGIYQHFDQDREPRSADFTLREAVGIYVGQLGATILEGVDRSRRHVDVRTPDAIRRIGGNIVEQETVDRLRTLDGGFMPAVLTAHRQLPRVKRFLHSAKFLATYPDRPSDVLLKGHDRIDTGAAQVQYGVWAGAEFSEAFEDIEPGYNPAECRAQVNNVLWTIITKNIGNEMAATHQALVNNIGK